MFQPKPLSPDAIEAALDKAERYRFLGEAWEADSVCRDVLAIDPDNQQALISLITAIAQQLGDGTGGDMGEAKRLVKRLLGEYERAFYSGLLVERRAKEMLAHGTLGVGPAVYGMLTEAMACYEVAEKIRPPGDDSAILRWNTCVRIIEKNHLKPAPGPPTAHGR